MSSAAVAGMKRSLDISDLGDYGHVGKRSKIFSGLATPVAELDSRLEMNVDETMLEDDNHAFPELAHGALSYPTQFYQKPGSDDQQQQQHMDVYTDPTTGTSRSFAAPQSGHFQQQGVDIPHSQQQMSFSPNQGGSLSVYPRTPPADDLSEAEAFARYALTHGYNKMSGTIEVMQSATGCGFGSDSIRELHEPAYNWDCPRQTPSTGFCAMNMGAHQI